MSASSLTDAPEKLEILVVENHPDTAKYLAFYLKGLGHAVRTAGTVEDALEKLSQMPGDVLMCDIGLPDGSGWDVLERAHLPPSVYAIAMSGFALISDQRRSAEVGYRHHVVKPFTPEILDLYLEEAQRERTGGGL